MQCNFVLVITWKSLSCQVKKWGSSFIAHNFPSQIIALVGKGSANNVGDSRENHKSFLIYQVWARNLYCQFGRLPHRIWEKGSRFRVEWNSWETNWNLRAEHFKGGCWTFTWTLCIWCYAILAVKKLSADPCVQQRANCNRWHELPLSWIQ